MMTARGINAVIHATWSRHSHTYVDVGLTVVVGVPVLSRSILLDVAAMRTGVAMRVMIA
jgi:hypothetical protein